MEPSTITSCIRFFERMAERVKRMEEEEARLTKESCKTIRAPILTKTRRSSGFGKGMVRRDKWQPGQPRITQEACIVVAEYAKDRAIARQNGQYIGRKSYADRAGISTATLNRCANEIDSGEIYLDASDGVWKAAPVRTNKETRLPPLLARETKPARCFLSSDPQTKI
jgi:hypothetical protein